MLVDKNIFIKFDFPEYQKFMEIEGFKENAVTPISLDENTSEFNSSIMIRKSWLDSI